MLEHGKGDKVVIYKYKAKKDYRRKNGHRQPYTLIKITEIGAAGEKKASQAEAKADAPKVSASMKKDELLEVAKELGVEVDSKATKADIIAAIEAK